MDKKNLILGGVLIVLIALAYAYQGPLKKWQVGMDKPKNFLSGVEAERISKVEITKNGDILILEKKADKWVVSDSKNFPVKNELAIGLIEELKKAKDSEMSLVSSNKEKKGDFLNGGGIALKLYDGKKITADFLIGKSTRDSTGTYITRADLNSTYSVKANINMYLDQAEWRDATIFSSDKEKISKIRFQHQSATFLAEKQNGEWQVTSPIKFKIGKGKIDKILGLMSDLTSAQIPEQTFKGTGLEKNLLIVQASGEGVDNTIMVGDKNAKSLYFAKTGISDWIYLITNAQRDILNISVEQLK